MVSRLNIFSVEVDLLLWAYDGPGWDVAPFRHREGWMMVGVASRTTPFGLVTATLVAAISDHGEVYSAAASERILDMPTSHPCDAEVDPPDQLSGVLDAHYWDFLGTTDLECLRQLEEADNINDAKVEKFEAECAAFEAKLWLTIRQLWAERRTLDALSPRRGEIDARLTRLLDLPEELARGMRDKIREMRAATDDLETAVMESLTDHGEFEVLYAARWRGRHKVSNRGDYRLPVNRDPGRTRHPWQDGGFAGRTLEQVAQMRPFQHERDD